MYWMMTVVEDNSQTDVEATYQVQRLADAKKEYFHMTNKYQAGRARASAFPFFWFLALFFSFTLR